MTPEERRLRARLGGLTRHAYCDSREATAPARKAFLERFYNQVDPERVLTPGERERRAEAAKKAHMTRLALKSAQARRARRSKGER